MVGVRCRPRYLWWVGISKREWKGKKGGGGHTVVVHVTWGGWGLANKGGGRGKKGGGHTVVNWQVRVGWAAALVSVLWWCWRILILVVRWGRQWLRAGAAAVVVPVALPVVALPVAAAIALPIAAAAALSVAALVIAVPVCRHRRRLALPIHCRCQRSHCCGWWWWWLQAGAAAAVSVGVLSSDDDGRGWWLRAGAAAAVAVVPVVGVGVVGRCRRCGCCCCCCWWCCCWWWWLSWVAVVSGGG